MCGRTARCKKTLAPASHPKPIERRKTASYASRLNSALIRFYLLKSCENFVYIHGSHGYLLILYLSVPCTVQLTVLEYNYSSICNSNFLLISTFSHKTPGANAVHSSSWQQIPAANSIGRGQEPWSEEATSLIQSQNQSTNPCSNLRLYHRLKVSKTQVNVTTTDHHQAKITATHRSRAQEWSPLHSVVAYMFFFCFSSRPERPT